MRGHQTITLTVKVTFPGHGNSSQTEEVAIQQVAEVLSEIMRDDADRNEIPVRIDVVNGSFSTDEPLAEPGSLLASLTSDWFGEAEGPVSDGE